MTWIPTDVRMPPCGHWVLAATDRGATVARLGSNERSRLATRWQRNNGTWISGEVSFWMPIPEPPEREEAVPHEVYTA